MTIALSLETNPTFHTRILREHSVLLVCLHSLLRLVMSYNRVRVALHIACCPLLAKGPDEIIFRSLRLLARQKPWPRKLNIRAFLDSFLYISGSRRNTAIYKVSDISRSISFLEEASAQKTIILLYHTLFPLPEALSLFPSVRLVLKMHSLSVFGTLVLASSVVAVPNWLSNLAGDEKVCSHLKSLLLCGHLY